MTGGIYPVEPNRGYLAPSMWAVLTLPREAAMSLLHRRPVAARGQRFSYRTERCYVYWAERYIRYHGIKHPDTMGEPEVEAFLTHLAVDGRVSASTQNQALGALLFLYRNVLGREL